MRAFIEIIGTEFKCFTRNFLNMFFVLAFPALFLILFGEIYGNKPSSLFNGQGTIDASVPAYIGMIITVTGIMSLPLALSSYREKKILKRFKATPMSPFHILISQIIVNLFMTVIGVAILILIAKLKYDLKFNGDVIAVVLVVLLSIFCIFSIGFLIASVVNGTKAANAVANLVYFPMLFLTGATIPLETMPNSIKNISKFLPLTHSIKVLKGAWQGKSLSDYGSDIMILIAVTIICSILSIKFFRWD
ncbi:ABC transporter permease [Clostridium prolinivorans]|uniref:ABC transporter permease n=1 Tax=Clostridium prolinivorans TaxID=2769420 RepID=UPI000FDA88B3|nr:ABC transporter permease [Clostridium prolinivorans]